MTAVLVSILGGAAAFYIIRKRKQLKKLQDGESHGANIKPKKSGEIRSEILVEA